MLGGHLEGTRYLLNGCRHRQVGTLRSKDVNGVLAIAQGLSHIEDRQFHTAPFSRA